MANNPSFIAYQKLRILSWETSEEGPIRNQAFPYSVIANPYGRETAVRFGAFIGWVENLQWMVDLASRLSLPVLDRFGLLDLEHQAGGFSVLSWRCVGFPAAIHESYLAFANDLCRDYYFAHTGNMNGIRKFAGDDEQYAERLRAVGLTADRYYAQHSLAESVYGFDGTDENLNLLLAQPAEVLSNLQPLVSDPIARDRLRIVIVADNSD